MAVSANSAAQQPGDFEEGPIAGLVAVGIVDQPEVVDVDQGDSDRAIGAPGLLEQVGQPGDRSAMVEQTGQRVAPAGIDKGPGLAGQPALGGLEDEVQQEAQEERRGDHHEGDLAGRVGHRVQDRLGVPVDLEDARNGAVGTGDRNVLLEQLAVGRKAGGRRVRVVGADDRGRHLTRVERGLEVVVRAEVPAAQVGPVAVEDGLVGAEDLDVDDPVRLDQGGQPGLDLGDPGVGYAGCRQVRGLQVGLEQADGQRLVGRRGRRDRGVLDVPADHSGKRHAGGSHQDEARTKDSQQEP